MHSDYFEMLRTLSSWVLVVFKDGHSTSSLDKLFQWLPSFWKRFFCSQIRILFIAICDHCLFFFLLFITAKSLTHICCALMLVTEASNESPLQIPLLKAEKFLSPSPHVSCTPAFSSYWWPSPALFQYINVFLLLGSLNCNLILKYSFRNIK